jgi:hypothetical protein
VPKAFLTVILIVLLAWAAADLRAIPCPVSGVTGVLSSPKDLEVQGLEFEQIGLEVLHWCSDDFETYTYVVTVLAENTATDFTAGYLQVAFYLAWSEKEDAEKVYWFTAPILIEIAPETTGTIEETVEHSWFRLHNYRVPRLEVQTGEDLECPYCSGKGRVSLTQWVKVIMR